MASEGAQVKRRVGSRVARARAGRWLAARAAVACPTGSSTRSDATVRMAELVAEHDAAEPAIDAARRERRELGATVRELGPSGSNTSSARRALSRRRIQDYGYLLAEPGTPHRRAREPARAGSCSALGDRADREGHDRARWRSSCGVSSASGISARSVNKHREVLAAMFSYAQREDTYALQHNPVSATSKRREKPPAVLDFFEPEEIEALRARGLRGRPSRRHGARARPTGRSSGGRGRIARTPSSTASPPTPGCGSASCSRCAGRTSTSERRRVIVHRAVSAGVEGPDKSRQARSLPLADAAARSARAARRSRRLHRPRRLRVLLRLGRRLDRSAVRRRYTGARDAAGLRPLRFHALRHAAGSLVAREAGAHFVQAFLGHSRLSTTERYCTPRVARRTSRPSTGPSPGQASR